MATIKVTFLVIIFYGTFVCALTQVPIFSSHSRENLTLNIIVKYPEERLEVSMVSNFVSFCAEISYYFIPVIEQQL